MSGTCVRCRNAKKTMIVVLARKLLIALWQLATTGTLLRAFASTRRSNARGARNATTRRACIDGRVADNDPRWRFPYPSMALVSLS